MSAGLDTSVTLRLLTGVSTEQATAAREFVAASPSPVVISDLVIAETYFALRHHYEVPHADAVRTLLALVSDSHFRTTGVARAVLADASTRSVAKSQPGFIDRLIHADYDRDTLRVVTFDRALGKLEGAQVLA
ncbi:MAG TPA: PIN domain-containing protein [Gemmatimonadaceae bacterium]|nr:PIN domain-containing protein [Gemmatimonadota bacterium]HPV77813.1 PIN domain-containing protein [Gemmatimonadaceae bacterium]